MSSHSPAPWRRFRTDGVVAVIAADESLVCHLKWNGDRGANAALIVAAPLLLSACRSLLHGIGNGSELPQAIEDASNAIRIAMELP
jgi:hypothetical protein